MPRSIAAKWNVMVSAPYMQPVIERFIPLFESEGIHVLVPTVHERLCESDLLGLVGEIDGAITGDDRFTRRVLDRARRLRVISKWGTGIDSIDRDACRDLGIRVCNTPNAFSVPVADSVLAAMLSFARRTPWMDRHMKAGHWEKIPGTSLAECTLGIVGVGNVGKAVARRAAGFGMTIVGRDPVAPPEDFVQETGIEMAATKEEVLERCDFLSLNCDLNPTSFHLMSDDAFARMKPNAVVINTARGPIIDEPALVRALQSKRIGGAALDVFEVEPLPHDSPLRHMDNVLLSPHNSNSSPAAWERVHQNTIKNLLAGLKEVQRWRNAS
ncbi:MAG: phosphoglycerate dehydrogenase [Tepidisphaeraceae bacterium]